MVAVRSWWRRRQGRLLLAGAALLLAGGGAALGVAATSQYDVPQPTAAAFGTTGRAQAPERARTVPPSTTPSPGRSPALDGPVLPASNPTGIAIPSIGVLSRVQSLGLNPDGTMQVPQPGPLYNEAGWYHYSPTPGQLGPSVIIGHIDSAAGGPSVFYRLGALEPGSVIDVARADGSLAVFTVSGVRQYPKAQFPSATIYGNTNFAALRLITCGGAFDAASGHYLENIVVFASLTSASTL